MDEIVKVIYEGANKRGFAIGKGEAIFFTPGMNEIPKAQWDMLIADQDPGSVQHFLDNRQMRLAETLDVNVPEDDPPKQAETIADMSAVGAIESVENAMTEGDLKKFQAEEKDRKSGRGERKTVMGAIKERLKMFAAVEQAEKDGVENVGDANATKTDD